MSGDDESPYELLNKFSQMDVAVGQPSLSINTSSSTASSSNNDTVVFSSSSNINDSYKELVERLRRKDEELKIAAELGLSLLTKLENSESKTQKLTHLYTSEMERADRLEEETRQLILNNTKLVKERSLSLQELHAAQSRLQDDKAIKDEMEEEERRAGVNLVAGLRRRCEILENENNELKTLVVANEDSFKQTELGLKAKLRSANKLLAEYESVIEKSQNDESSVSSGRPLSASSAKRTSALTKKFKENNNDGDVSSSPAGDLSSSSSPVFLVSMIKDLTQVNDRMKLELSETRDLLEAARNEIQELQNMLYNENVDSATSSFKHSHTLLPVPQHPQQHQQQQSIFGELESYVLSQSQKSSSQVASYSPTSKLRQHHSQRIVTNQDPLTADDVTSLRSISPDFSSVASDSSSSSKRFWMFISPIATNFRALFERLSASDTLTLNRQLKRQFDVEKITNMSNVVIDNVMDDIESFSIEFTKSFLQVTAAAAATKGVTLNTPTAIIPQQLSNISTLSSTTTLLKVTEHENNVFLELVHLMHDILVDNGNLRTNINEIARAYYEVKEQAASKGGGSSTGGGGGAKKGGFFSSWSRSNSLESLPQ